MPDAPRKKIQLGQPLQLTDEELDQLAEITPADQAQAAALWRSSAPDGWETLLDADEEDQ